ncbi:MAG: penicillin-binding protein, partial [Candidatus Uhrbacteria bacterium]|nr:penicillin-binding protein [Candidatus Uhrbacteria bacterium]
MQRYAKYRHYLHKNPVVQALARRLRNLPKKTIAKNVLLLGLGIIFAGLLVLLLAYAWYSRELPSPGELLNRDIEQSTKIYDRTGEHLLYEIAGNKKRTLVSLDEIPDDLEHAALAAEDASFYSHHGISIKGILRAALYQGRRGGGSTITQQLVKNAILSNEKTLDRKFKEILLSLALEQRFTKDEILQMYFNEIGYGGRNYGIESASQEYYGKPATDLTLAESATLAGLPQVPTTYLNNLELLKERRDWILGRMVELGYITQEQADEAIAEELDITVSVTNITAPHFVMWVKEQLVDLYSEREVEEGGFKVVTTLDYDKQLIAEQAVVDGVAARGADYNYNNAALMSVDPKTGQVLAMVGSADYFNDEIDGQVNVTQRLRQPGSSIKPIVYSAAF